MSVLSNGRLWRRGCAGGVAQLTLLATRAFVVALKHGTEGAGTGVLGRNNLVRCLYLISYLSLSGAFTDNQWIKDNQW